MTKPANDVAVKAVAHLVPPGRDVRDVAEPAEPVTECEVLTEQLARQS